MTRTPRSPFLPFVVLTLLFLSVFSVNTSAAARGKKAAKAQPAKSSRASKGREKSARGKASARETRAERRSRGRANDRASARGGKLSKRERLAQARREAEERRRRAEAARRAELARLAAIARQRALDNSLREEVQADIAKDDTTGEDLEVRRAAVNALGNHAGSVVVMNPKTGRIYTVVNQEWGVRRGFKPCSTIKLVTGLAGLTEGVIDPVAENASYGNRMNLTDALAVSHNGYFQQVGRTVGFERMSSYARQLGLGERTGINHANEFPGRLPLFKNDVGMLRMSSHGDDIEVTPVQLAALASVFANGGTLLTPHLPRTPEEDVKFRPEVRRQLNVPQESLRRMMPGMIGSVNYGSGRKAYDPQQTIAGKTGTCIGSGSVWVGLFTSYAPVEDPQLAIAVVGRGSDARGHFPAAVAGQIYRALNYRFGKHGGKSPFALTPDMLAPKPKIDPSTIADTDDEEEKAADAATNPATDLSKPGESAAPAAGSVRQVLMPVTQQAQPRPASTPGVKPAPVTKTPPPASSDQTMSTGGRPRRVTTKNQ
ncbi:MAG TPA: penicillin-binding transpeptidase domain-containing protein [Pyrinomonadaceae bacterium]|jgi:membrane peptidoglycan carboxypeptidase|nr:penicillin-binding transpeptidase domain-containing protein [Pyrinomonadaceae bacterium]